MSRPREKATGGGPLTATMAFGGEVTAEISVLPSPFLTPQICLSSPGLIEPEPQAGDPQMQFTWVNLSGDKEDGEGWRSRAADGKYPGQCRLSGLPLIWSL